jgi:hypothetical protein
LAVVSLEVSCVSSPVELVEELARRFRAGNREAAVELFHADFRIQQPESLPHGGWHQGSDGMVTMAATFDRYWTRTITDPMMYGCGDLVLQITKQTWTSKDTGSSATVDVVELITVADDLIREIRVFQQDTHLLLETLADDET